MEFIPEHHSTLNVFCALAQPGGNDFYKGKIDSNPKFEVHEGLGIAVRNKLMNKWLNSKLIENKALFPLVAKFMKKYKKRNCFDTC